MKKIFIVQTSYGTYEDFHIHNEKAFISHEKAKEYAKELDDIHNRKPVFTEDTWDEAWEYISNIEEKEPNRFINNIKYCPENMEEWTKRNEETENDLHQELLNYIHKHVSTKYTLDDILQHVEYDNAKYMDYHPCGIKELELDDTE